MSVTLKYDEPWVENVARGRIVGHTTTAYDNFLSSLRLRVPIYISRRSARRFLSAFFVTVQHDACVAQCTAGIEETSTSRKREPQQQPQPQQKQ